LLRAQVQGDEDAVQQVIQRNAELQRQRQSETFDTALNVAYDEIASIMESMGIEANDTNFRRDPRLANVRAWWSRARGDGRNTPNAQYFEDAIQAAKDAKVRNDLEQQRQAQLEARRKARVTQNRETDSLAMEGPTGGAAPSLTDDAFEEWYGNPDNAATPKDHARMAKIRQKRGY